MSEIQKLRALLAQARPILWLHRPSGDTDCSCRQCSAIIEVVARIDAALAEPVEAEPHGKGVPTPEEFVRSSQIGRPTKHIWGWSGFSIGVMVAALLKERDEARAEVAYWKGEFMRLHDEHLPSAFAGAYRRGAEAMREAAAQEIERQVDALMMRAGLAADIRALPVPEDKP